MINNNNDNAVCFIKSQALVTPVEVWSAGGGALEELSYSHNSIAIIAGLHGLGQLQALNFSSNCLPRLAGLQSLTALRSLHLSRNYIQAIPALDVSVSSHVL